MRRAFLWATITLDCYECLVQEGSPTLIYFFDEEDEAAFEVIRKKALHPFGWMHMDSKNATDGHAALANRRSLRRRFDMAVLNALRFHAALTHAEDAQEAKELELEVRMSFFHLNLMLVCVLCPSLRNNILLETWFCRCYLKFDQACVFVSAE